MAAKLCLDPSNNFCYASLDDLSNYATFHWRDENLVRNGTTFALDASRASSNSTALLALPGDTEWVKTRFYRVRVDSQLLRVRCVVARICLQPCFSSWLLARSSPLTSLEHIQKASRLTIPERIL